MLELPRRLIYSVCFHPGYRTNRFLYVFSNGPTGAGERTNRISRFRVAAEDPRAAEAASETLILEWRSARVRTRRHSSASPGLTPT